MDLLLIGGVSGSGKSVALTALEDSGHYAVSNLPPPQLAGLLAHLKSAGTDRVAVVLDVKTGGGLADLPVAIDSARAEGWTVRFLYLDATTETLVKRFSETRRRHPFSGDERTLTEAIEFERALFADLRALGYSFDTSDQSAAAWRSMPISYSTCAACRTRTTSLRSRRCPVATLPWSRTSSDTPRSSGCTPTSTISWQAGSPITRATTAIT